MYDNGNKMGKVVTYIAAKGFGFIQEKKDEKNVFFHISAGLKTQLVEEGLTLSGIKETRVPEVNDRLVFISSIGDKGPYAVSWGFVDKDKKVESVQIPNNAEKPGKKVEMVINDPTPPHGDKTMRKESGRRNPYERQPRRIKDNTDGEKDWRKNL